MQEKIKNAVDIAQRAQRNYDLSKVVPENDLETLIYTAINSPSKQNEIHYAVDVYSDQYIIREIYNCTKLFSLSKGPSDLEEQCGITADGKFWQDSDKAVHNSQILANVLFVYSEDEGVARGGTHKVAQENRDAEMYSFYQEQKNYSMGISIGQLILAASLMGYKTGICSAINADDVKKIVACKGNPKVLVGIGFENQGVDRRLHAKTLNKDIPPKFRNGELEEKWRFPSFNKKITVKLNGRELE
jgi:nitroreductase